MSGNNLRSLSPHKSWRRAIVVLRKILADRASTANSILDEDESLFQRLAAMSDDEIVQHVFTDMEMDAVTDLMMAMLPIESDDFSTLADFIGESMRTPLS